MFVKTSRWTGESSNHPSTSGPSPEPMLKSAQKTPKPMTRWYGRTRFFIRARTYSPPDLGFELPERLLVELAHLLCKRGQQLVGQLRYLVEDRRELARSEDEHRDRTLGGDRRRAWPLVEQRQLA